MPPIFLHHHQRFHWNAVFMVIIGKLCRSWLVGRIVGISIAFSSCELDHAGQTTKRHSRAEDIPGSWTTFLMASFWICHIRRVTGRNFLSLAGWRGSSSWICRTGVFSFHPQLKKLVSSALSALFSAVGLFFFASLNIFCMRNLTLTWF